MYSWKVTSKTKCFTKFLYLSVCQGPYLNIKDHVSCYETFRYLSYPFYSTEENKHDLRYYYGIAVFIVEYSYFMRHKKYYLRRPFHFSADCLHSWRVLFILFKYIWSNNWPATHFELFDWICLGSLMTASLTKKYDVTPSHEFTACSSCLLELDLGLMARGIPRPNPSHATLNELL
jgi:hypothetical protein